MPTTEDWIRLYSNDNHQIRLRAAQALLERPRDVPLEILIDILVSLSWEGLGAKTEKALLLRKDPELVGRMIELLRSEHAFVRQVACTVLGRSEDKAATPYLLRMIDDSNAMVRRAAGFGLAFLKDRSALQELRHKYEQHRSDDLNVVMALECALKSLAETVEER